MVAKSYANDEILDAEPFVRDGRQYVTVLHNGERRVVRYYTEAEYAKLYPRETIPMSNTKPVVKEALGFAHGPITIYKGPVNNHEDYLNMCPATRFNRVCGWYTVSGEAVPSDLPSDLTPISLNWETIGNPDGTLKLEDEAKAAVEDILYDGSVSKYIGKIKDRIEITVKILSAYHVDGDFGVSIIHTMEDEKGNQYVWKTASKWLLKDRTYKLRGTVKEHKIYKGTKQTWLTRCSILEGEDK